MKKKILLIFVGLLISTLLLELGMRLAGFTYFYFQEQGNKRSLKNKDTYKILCLGESTTAGQYPRFLEEELNSRGIGVRFSVIDKGRPATNSNYILANLNIDLDKYKPDMVITMMGVGDIMSDMVVDEYVKTVSCYKELKIYKLMRLIDLHMQSKAGEIKNAVWSMAGKSYENIQKLRISKQMKMVTNGEGIGTAAKVSGDWVKYAEKGRNYLDRKEYKESEVMYKKALSLGPLNEQAYLDMAELYKSTGRYEEAEKMYEREIEINPEDEQGYLKLGDLCKQQGKIKEAQELYKKAIDITPSNEQGYMSLAGCYADQGRVEEAEKVYKRMIELNPKSYQVYMCLVSLGSRYLSEGKLKDAEDAYKKALEVNQGKEAFYLISKTYELQNRPEEAARMLNESMKLDNESDMRSDYSLIFNTDKQMGIKYKKVKDEAGSLYFSAGTIYNYKKLREILKQKNITYVCVQYPMKQVEDLKVIFTEDKGIYFVDNEKTFRNGVEKEGYNAYFIDKFAKVFGHATQKGNKMLARNIADTIITDVFSSVPHK